MNAQNYFLYYLLSITASVGFTHSNPRDRRSGNGGAERKIGSEVVSFRHASQEVTPNRDRIAEPEAHGNTRVPTYRSGLAGLEGDQAFRSAPVWIPSSCIFLAVAGPTPWNLGRLPGGFQAGPVSSDIEIRLVERQRLDQFSELGEDCVDLLRYRPVDIESRRHENQLRAFAQRRQRWQRGPHAKDTGFV